MWAASIGASVGDCNDGFRIVVVAKQQVPHPTRQGQPGRPKCKDEKYPDAAISLDQIATPSHKQRSTTPHTHPKTMPQKRP